MFSKTIISLYGGIGVLQSVRIGLINSHNLLQINKGDGKDRNTSTSDQIIDTLFLGTVTVLKSGLYGICWPLSQYCIYNDIKTTGCLKQHFCPGYNISPVLEHSYDISQWEGKLYLPSC